MLSNTSLSQGLKFNKNKNIFLKKKIIEGNTNMEESIEQRFMKYKSEFEITLDKYNKAYKKLLNSKLNEVPDVSKYKGKVIEYNGKYYFVNKKGVKRELKHPIDEKYNNHAELTSKHGCPAFSDSITNPHEFEKIPKGAPLEFFLDETDPDNGNKTYHWQKCSDPWNFQGNMFVNHPGNPTEISYIDDKGYRYHFKVPFNAKSKTHHTCPKNTKTHLIDTYEYKYMMPAIETDLTVNDECKGKVNDLETDITVLNNKLEELAINMREEIYNLELRNSNTDETINASGNTLNEIKIKLEEKRKQIDNLKKEIHSLEGNIIDNKHLVKSINLKYMAWGLSLVTVSALIYKLKK